MKPAVLVAGESSWACILSAMDIPIPINPKTSSETHGIRSVQEGKDLDVEKSVSNYTQLMLNGFCR